MRPEDKTKTKSFDLIYKGMEITTGAQREHRYDILKQQALEKGLSLEPLSDYLNCFKYGCPPHGGFGMSPARFIICFLNLDNIREATLFPRDPRRLNP
jgi:aspartyl/asparaginyl-tRNA synthetase